MFCFINTTTLVSLCIVIVFFLNNFVSLEGWNESKSREKNEWMTKTTSKDT